MKPEFIVGGIVVVLVAIGLGTLFIKPSSSSQEAMVDSEPTQMVDDSTPSDVMTDEKDDAMMEDGTKPTAVAKVPAKKAGTPYHEITNPSGFVNTPFDSSGQATPITIKQFIGKKVILIDFLTYSCINCQRTFPYINAWDEKYRNQGLIIIGIHTPEFAFEKDIDNVREAMKKFGITHPIVLDNDYGTWRAWGNQYWPREYLIDINGNVVYDHAGEGAYDTTEKKIQELLAERAKVLGEKTSMDSSLAVSSIASNETAARSPETYFGSDRNEYLGNGSRGKAGEQGFKAPMIVFSNVLYLNGTWNIVPEYAEAGAGASITYKYNAKNVYFVAEGDSSAEIEVLQDGKPIGAAAGADVKNGILTVTGSRLYTVISNNTADQHTLELKIKSGKLRAYTFTFG